MPISNNDRDVMIRTIIGEAADQSPEGQAAVAHVIMNRSNSPKFGGSPSDVVFSPGQFEPWSTRKTELSGISMRSRQYQNVGAIVDSVASGQTPDPTGGATYFRDPTLMKKRGDTVPNWGKGPGLTIGDHVFYNPDNPNYPNASSPSVKSVVNAALAAPPDVRSITNAAIGQQTQ